MASFDYCSFTYTILEDTTNVQVNGLDAGVGVVDNPTIPDTVTNGGTQYTVMQIKDNAFQSKNLTGTLTIGNNITSIGSSAFYLCTSLTKVTIHDSVTSIGSSAFRDCIGLTAVTIPDSVRTIGSSAFRSCTSLKAVTIPDSVTSIGNWAFGDCTSLTAATIGNSVRTIGNFAFYGCTSLTEVYVVNSANITTVNLNSFTDLSGGVNYEGSIISFGNSEDSVTGNWNIIKNYYQTQKYNYTPLVFIIN